MDASEARRLRFLNRIFELAARAKEREGLTGAEALGVVLGVAATMAYGEHVTKDEFAEKARATYAEGAEVLLSAQGQAVVRGKPH